jgi:hypothetical protein
MLLCMTFFTCYVCEVVASNLHLYSDILVMRFNGFLIMGS